MNGSTADAGATSSSLQRRRPLAWLVDSPSGNLALILAIGLIIRTVVIAAFPSLYHPDENFQFFEQAHRIAFGYGITPWEFRDGIRSLLLPSVFARLFSLSARLGAGPEQYLFIARLSLALLSLVTLACVYRMALRTSRTHAIVTGTVVATWFELIYFAPRPLTEAIAANFLIMALALSSVPEQVLTARRLRGIGACLGICLMLRMHLLLGLAVVACGVARLDFRSKWPHLLLGGIVPVLLFGGFDWLTWGSPFHSYIAAYRVNAIEGKASHYGVRPLYWYLQCLAQTWAGALPVLIALILVRTRASMIWILSALAIIASHSLIPHKEYRFVFPAFASLVIVAAMGSADLLQWMRDKLGLRSTSLAAAGCLALWTTASASLALAPGYADNWVRDRDVLLASFGLSQRSDVCGVMLYDYPWYSTGGYSYLHKRVPLYQRPSATVPAMKLAAAFNYVFLQRRSLDDFGAPFMIEGCMGDGRADDLCVISRRGNCSMDESLVPLLQQQGLGE